MDAMVTHAPAHDETMVGHQLAVEARVVENVAIRCDAMCLTAGTHLANAVPGVSELSGQFSSLCTMLEGENVLAATRDLEEIAASVVAIGQALGSERETLGQLTKLNGALSRRIADVFTDVRLLSAMVSSVKIELASIDQEGERLEGFATNLEMLAKRARDMLVGFRDTHNTLMEHLRKTVTAQSAFESANQVKLSQVASDIVTSLAVVSERRAFIATMASEIGGSTQRIGMQIGRTVVALQAGDMTRQRLEHVGHALKIASALALAAPLDNLKVPPLDDTNAALRQAISMRLCALQAKQIAGAGDDFASDISTIGLLLAQVVETKESLLRRSDDLIGSNGVGNAQSFLGDLEQKLVVARALIDRCRESRVLVDATAETVIATVIDLKEPIADIASMAIDMTIIGTNAIVTAYRLGSRGEALSVLAQHLRSNALQIADGVTALHPALGEVLQSAERFVASRKGQDAAALGTLGTRMETALGAFQAADAALSDLHRRLDHEVHAVSATLRRAVAGLEAAKESDAALARSAATVRHVDGIDEVTDGSLEADEWIDAAIRKTYTMQQERVIHDGFLSLPEGEGPVVAEAADADMWL